VPVPVPLVDPIEHGDAGARWEIRDPHEWAGFVFLGRSKGHRGPAIGPNRKSHPLRELPPEFVLREVLDVDLGLVDDHLDKLRRDDGSWNTSLADDAAACRRLRIDAELTAIADAFDDGWCGRLSAPGDIVWRRPDLFDKVGPVGGILRMRTLVDHLVAAQDGEPLGDVWGYLYGDDLDDEACWTHFASTLNPFLALPVGVVPADGQFVAGFDVAMAFQVRQLVQERLPFRTCANERCGRRFVRHRGVAQAGQHRVEGGVKFCSPACTSAQVQREYRRRKAAEQAQAQATKRGRFR
jgi:hypothetical protein